MKALQEETDNNINQNNVVLQQAILEQEGRMQALATQQAASMAQVNGTIAEMQARVGQLDQAITTMNANMQSQFATIMALLTNNAATAAQQ